MIWQTWRRLVSLVIDKSQHLNKHNKQSQWICETLINTITYSPKIEPKVVKFERKSSIPIQNWLGKNNNIQIHHNIGTSQDLNPSACSSLVIFMYCACVWQGSVFPVLRSEGSGGQVRKDSYCGRQCRGVGDVRSGRFLGGVGFLTTLGVGVGFSVRFWMSNWFIFYITLLNWEFLLKWYNLFLLKLVLKLRFLSVQHDFHWF